MEGSQFVYAFTDLSYFQEGFLFVFVLAIVNKAPINVCI